MLENRRRFLKSAAVLPFVAGVSRAAGKSPVAETKYGNVRGETTGGISVFRGMPYGGDTSGKNRFMAPTKPASWKGIREATQWGHVAPQAAGNNSEYTKMVDWLNKHEQRMMKHMEGPPVPPSE